MAFSLGFGSCWQYHCQPRADQIIAGTKAFYMMGDIAYMDGQVLVPGGSTQQPYTLYMGDSTENVTLNKVAAGGAVQCAASVGGAIPCGTSSITAVTDQGSGFPVSSTFTANLVGNGGQNAVALLTTDGTGKISSTAASSYVINGGSGYASNAGTSYTLANMCWTPGFWARRFLHTMGTSFWQDIQKARNSGWKFYFYADDHERANNWDFSIAQAQGASTLSDVVDYWRMAEAGLNSVWPLYFDNQPEPGNDIWMDIPPSMVGQKGNNGVPFTTADLKKRFFHRDYDAVGNELTNVSGVDGGVPSKTAVRVLVLDTISSKSTQAQADTVTKVMIGLKQEQWLYTRCQQAVAAGVKAIWIFSGKDTFNADNQDGWGATAGGGNFPYITQRDRILTWLTTNNIPAVWMTGDRHCAHVAYTAVANGDTYDHFAVCATPLGSQNNTTSTRQTGNTIYPAMLWQHRGRDQCVHGLISYDDVNGGTLMQVIDNQDNQEAFAAFVPLGARIPSLPYGVRYRR